MSVGDVTQHEDEAAVASNGHAPHEGNGHDPDAQETQEWLDSLEAILYLNGKDRARYLLTRVGARAETAGVAVPFSTTTPYVNTIPPDEEPPYPGNREMERKIKSLVRWNAMAMVVQANDNDHGLGGHIGTFASCANLHEVGYNHFFKGPDAPGGGDLVYFQGHASPGMYARAYLEGRLTEQQLKNFRRELA